MKTATSGAAKKEFYSTEKRSLPGVVRADQNVQLLEINAARVFERAEVLKSN